MNPSGKGGQGPLYVRFDAPNRYWYDLMLQILYRHGYTEVIKKGEKGLVPGRFSRSEYSLRIQWKEILPARWSIPG